MISYQLYSSRNHGTASEVIARVAEIGYRAVEGYGALVADSRSRASITDALKDTAVAMPTAHVGLATLETDPAIAEALADMGVTAIYVPHIAAEERPSDKDGWRAFAERVAAAGKAVRAAGMRYGWHNHDFEFVPLADGTVPMTHLLDADLEWQFDVAWCVRAGVDPLDWISQHGDRITAVHVKDIAAPGTADGEDGWADPGSGTMDWPALAAALARSGTVRRWVMEHDNPSDDARFAKQALVFGQSDPSISQGA